MNERVKLFFKQNIGYIMVGFACTVYILTAFLTVDKAGKTVAEIVADGALAFFLGLFINRIFDLQGVMSGERETRVLETRQDHERMVCRIAPFIDRLDDWCRQENAKNYRQQRTRILAKAGLVYEDCFDEAGVAKDWHPEPQRLADKRFKKGEKEKKRAFSHAVHLRLTALSTGDLTGDGSKAHDPYFMGRTKAQYEAERGVSDIVSKVCTALIFGYYGVHIIESFDYATLIWSTLQVALFLAMGVISMYKSYNFVVDELRGRVVKKIDNLQKFENYIKEQGKHERGEQNDGV